MKFAPKRMASRSFWICNPPRAKGLALDATENFGGTSLSVNNPNMPPPVQDTSAIDVKSMLDAGAALQLIDVRTHEERQRANIEGSTLLDQDSVSSLEALPRTPAWCCIATPVCVASRLVNTSARLASRMYAAWRHRCVVKEVTVLFRSTDATSCDQRRLTTPEAPDA